MKNPVFLLTIVFTAVTSILLAGFTYSKTVVHYFDFDEADHYFIQITKEEIKELNKGDEFDLSSRDQQLSKVLFRDLSGKSKDTLFVAGIDTIGYHQKDISRRDLKLLHELFVEQELDSNAIFNLCSPIYRDVLVFRKHNQISGIAKVCFECGKLSMYGYSGDAGKVFYWNKFGPLHQLLYKK